jgi:Carboxypeptidase regulatory-like domain
MRQFALSNLFQPKQAERDSIARTLRFAALCCVVMFVIAVMTPLGARAQLAGKGAITGTVTDTTGALIPGATVSALNTATGIAATTTTSGGGNYLFSDLDPGIYTVTTTAKGFQKLVQENIHVDALESQSYNPVLAVGNANVQITVTAEPPQLETSNAVLGATMENHEYSQLPIEMGAYGQADQRRATDFAFLMPGVQGNNTNGNATTNTGVVNGSGSRGAASDVYVDGIPFVRAGGNGDPRYVWTAISVDAVDQMQVQTNGYSAMYEGQGVMNYSIKQGGQQYHGSVYEFFRNTKLDSWGFFRAQDPVTLMPVKPIEHMNEYGIAIGGPLIPFGGIKNKLFFFTNYNGFRYASENPTPMRYPTTSEMNGDFSADGVNLYDPASWTSGASCPGGSPAGSACRTQFTNGTTLNAIPTNRIPAFVTNMQKFLPAISSTALGNNYTPPNKTGLSNWSTTSRIDYTIDSRDTLTVLGSVGRQASSNPVGQTTAGRNVGPVPYNYGQTYAPKTAVWAVELTHVFSPSLINQLKWGYARYNGPTFNPDDSTKYSATTMGLSGMPTGQAQSVFPITTFSGGAVVPTNWGGTTENKTIAANYTVLDTVNWNLGKHSFTFGGQVAWMLYNVVNATNGSTPLTLANAVSETAQVNTSSTAVSGTGLPYASFLLGQIDKGSFTSYLQNEFGARFRAISPYVQDDWKVTSKLTVNLGLRYDFYPTITEVHNAEGFFNPTLANPVTGLNGALQFTGTGANTCNCSTPVKNYYKNWGPRLGAAYQLGSKTVIRASWGVMFSHGDAVGGLASSLGTLGFSAAPSFSSSLAETAMSNLLVGGSGAIPTYTLASGAASGPGYGTGYAGNSTAPSSMQYNDPYLGGRAPEYLNWNLGIQRQITNTITANVNYVGSEGHFLQLDSNHARGYWADDLDPKYVALLGYNVNASHLSDTSNLATDCTTYSLPCPSATLMANTKQALSTFLKPFPFQTVGDTFGYVGNSNYHAMQAMLSMRRWHGLTLSANYTFAKTIDDGGSFRTGYPIPVGTMANHLSQSFAADRYERGVSTSNQPQHFVATAVWDWPFGRTYFAGNATERAILGGFTWSGVYQAFTGSPLALTESSNQTNPAQVTQMPIMNPNFSGPVRVNGKWGKGTLGTSTIPGTKTVITNPSYIAPSTGTTVATAAGPFMNPVTTMLSSYNYLFSDAPRTAPYGLYGPSNYQVDIAMIRSFPLHITEATKLDFRAEIYNLTNHTFFAPASVAVGNASFGQATSNGSLNRKSAQFSMRVEF